MADKVWGEWQDEWQGDYIEPIQCCDSILNPKEEPNANIR